MKKLFLSLLVLPLVLSISGCSSVKNVFSTDEDAPIEGKRLSILELQKSLEPEDLALETQGLVTPDVWRNEFWPQAGGYPNHSMQNLAFTTEQPKRAWKVSIGEGSSDEIPLTAQPVVVNGHIFTLDTEGYTTAFSTENGEKIWRKYVGHPKEDDPVIGGGIAYGERLLYITNGFNEIVALRPNDGETIWRAPLPAPSRAAPTIIDGRIFVTTIDNHVLALNDSNGAVLWEHAGLSETAGLVGAASPAANQDIVVPVFSSGEIMALRVENGSVAWSDNLSGARRFGGLSGLSDIKALPIIDKGMVIAMSFSNKLVAIDERTGTRLWQREIGGTETPWLAGNHIFVLTSDSQLVALGRDSGTIRWVGDLPRYKDEEDRKGPIFWNGPILAGGRLIVVSTHGAVLEISPENGSQLRQWDADADIATAPVIAAGTLYLLGENGTLQAYR